jgi:hypothetical protein
MNFGNSTNDTITGESRKPLAGRRQLASTTTSYILTKNTNKYSKSGHEFMYFAGGPYKMQEPASKDTVIDKLRRC